MPTHSPGEYSILRAMRGRRTRRRAEPAPHAWLPEDDVRLKDLWQNRKNTIDIIAIEMDRTYDSVRKAAHRLGLSRRQPPVFDAQKLEMLGKLRNENMSFRQLAQYFNVSIGCVYYYCEKYNFQRSIDYGSGSPTHTPVDDSK